MRLVTSILSLLAMGISALGADIVVFDTIPANATTAIVSVRAKGQPWGVVWDMADSAHYDMARFVGIPDARQVDAAFPEHATLEVVRVMGDSIAILATAEVPNVDSRTWATIKVMFDGHSARLYAGGDDLATRLDVPFEPALAAAVGYRAPERTRVERAHAVYFSLPTVRHSSWADLDSLAAHLQASTDPAEGLWQYLDRDLTEPASLGGRYLLATVRSGDEYQILYLSGSSPAHPLWRPLDIKGTMRPTMFVGNYDLTWQCADGRILDDDTYATIDDNHAILTLHFPVERATLRFRACPPSSLATTER